MKPQSRPPFSEIVSELEKISAGQQAEQTGSVKGESGKKNQSFLLYMYFLRKKHFKRAVHMCFYTESL